MPLIDGMKERMMTSSTMRRTLFLVAAAGWALAPPATAQVAKAGNERLSSLSFTSPSLAPSQPLVSFEKAQASLARPLRDGWVAFRLGTDDSWQATVDQRTGRVSLAEGSGLAVLPGAGNRLQAADV